MTDTHTIEPTPELAAWSKRMENKGRPFVVNGDTFELTYLGVPMRLYGWTRHTSNHMPFPIGSLMNLLVK